MTANGLLESGKIYFNFQFREMNPEALLDGQIISLWLLNSFELLKYKSLPLFSILQSWHTQFSTSLFLQLKVVLRRKSHLSD